MMPASVLQTYLRLNLLELGGEDIRYQKLQAAASELADGFARAPKSALPILLATLRSDQEVNDAFTNVANTIESHWTTYHGAFLGGAAKTLYKAVALQALLEAVDMQPVLGAAISLLMRNFGPQLEVGKNKVALDLLVDAADAAFTAESEEAMTHPTEQNLILSAAVKPTKFDRAALQKRIEAAVGPHNRASQAGDNPNPHWSNSAANWSYDFSDRLTALLADYLDNAMSKASDMDAKNVAALGNKFKEVTTQSDPGLKRATSLLWWRQALYSESADQPYRELQLIDMVVHAVIDLSAFIPAAYERALESFLTEAILSLQPSQDEIAQSELLKLSPKASSKLSSVVKSEATAGLLLSAIIKNDDVTAIIHASLPPQKWAVWLLRELKALQALENPKPVPEKDDSNE